MKYNFKTMNSEQLKKIKSFFKSYPAIRLVYFFGSHAKKEAGPASDYDFAVYLKEKDAKKMFDLKLSLMDKIGRLFKTDKVDIVILNTAESPELKFSIIKDGKLIFERGFDRVLVEPRIMNEYFDFHSLLVRHSLTKS